MKAIIHEYFKSELQIAESTISAERNSEGIVTANFKSARTVLQRAHSLAQAHPSPHAIVHWKMLKLAWQQRD